MCLYPRIIQNKKYTANKKNGGVIPDAADNRVKAVTVGCGECMECRKKKKREWQVRLMEEIKTTKDGQMVTLTFNTESLKQLYQTKEVAGLKGYERDNAVATKAIRMFTERWRKTFKKTIRHWLITELGQTNTEHVHLHGILWTAQPKEVIQQHWKYGNIWAGYDNKKTYVGEKTVNYMIKYVTKRDEKHKYYKPIILCSKGIGKNYTESMNAKNNKYKETETNETYRTNQGYKIALPIYYRNKIYTEEEREKLWIEKLNKQVRYVNGQKIKIDKNEEEYWKALKAAQQLNERLGYGNIQKDWKEKQYEEQRRIYLQEERIKK